MIVSLKHQRYILLAEKIDESIGLLKRHIAGAGLGVIGVKEVRVGKNHAVAIIRTILCNESFEPLTLFASECARCSVKGYVEVLSSFECGLKPKYRRSYIRFKIYPPIEKQVMVAQDMEYLLVKSMTVRVICECIHVCLDVVAYVGTVA